MISNRKITVKAIPLLFRQWREKKAALIDQSAVLKDIYLDVDISAGYFLMLTLANLIALNGLIQNSAAVIIGAMLISPLMGPILSFGFAFTTGDQFIWQKTVRKIAMSVAVTIIVSLITTYLSPLKDVTSEIVSRTRPNLFDLFIAFFAGTAGAIAICTKKNYMTIVPGVAIATAVIPPLSVAGFGFGIWNLKIAFGGFFLFFTNFVAIVISTCIVFFLYGFSPKYLKEEDISSLKKRITALAGILFIISIPLIYTLHQSITSVRLRSSIEAVLQESLSREGRTNLASFSYTARKDGVFTVNSVINAVTYLKEGEVAAVEQQLRSALGKDVKLYMEQIQVQPGGLKEPNVKTPLDPAIAPSRSPVEVIRRSREGTLAVIRQSAEKLEKVIAPSSIADFYVSFHDKSLRVSMQMKIMRDTPLSEEETLWLKRILATDLNMPVDLTVETVPFVPLLIFRKGETAITPEMKQTLMGLKDIAAKSPAINVTVEAYTGTYDDRKKLSELSDQRVKAIVDVLVADCGIPRDAIHATVIKSRKIEAPAVKVSVSTISGKS